MLFGREETAEMSVALTAAKLAQRIASKLGPEIDYDSIKRGRDPRTGQQAR